MKINAFLDAFNKDSWATPCIDLFRSLKLNEIEIAWAPFLIA